jgi:hypothetical protein
MNNDDRLRDSPAHDNMYIYVVQEFLYTGAVTTPGVTREDKVRLLSFAEHYNIPGLMTAKAWKEYARIRCARPMQHLSLGISHVRANLSCVSCVVRVMCAVCCQVE